MFDDVVGLDTVFQEEVVAVNQIANVMGNREVVDAVNRENTGVRVVNRVTDNVGIADVSVHMEVNAVATDNSRLAALSDLCVGDVAHETLIGGAVHHYVSTILVRDGIGVSSYHDVTGEQSNLSPDREGMSTVEGLHNTEMCIYQRIVKTDDLVGNINRADGSSFGFVVIASSRSNYDDFTDLPVYRIGNGDAGVSMIRSGSELTPCFNPRSSVHVELAAVATDGLISKPWELLVVVASVQDECKLVCVWDLLGTSTEDSKVHDDASGFNDHFAFVGKDNTALHNDDFEVGC